MQRVLVYFLSNLFIFTSLTFTQDFSWNQSQSQAFYYFDSASFDELENTVRENHNKSGN